MFFSGDEEEDLEDIDDEEMDDETDYARDYFDNGEGYLDEEDDNLDEGGIYWTKVQQIKMW